MNDMWSETDQSETSIMKFANAKIILSPITTDEILNNIFHGFSRGASEVQYHSK